jgi:teichuronic acid biosynthesis glycosyltransferase TuaH
MIFVSLENWDEIWRRNQFLCAGLAQRYPHSKILFVGLARDVSNRLRRGRFSELRQPPAHAVPGYPSITFTQPLKVLPNSLQSGRRINETMMRRHIQKAAAALQLRAPLLWINDHAAVHLAGRMDERGVIYDITDDWTLATIPEKLKVCIQTQDEQLCHKADLVVVCSEDLQRTRGNFGSKVLLLPNGVDVRHYRDLAMPSLPPEANLWPAPVFGYTGTLHDDRINVDLVIALARAFPDGSVVLIGPDALSVKARARLQDERNISLIGAVPYAHIPEYMARFDVCIVPHHETAFTESLNPIKLWEYLACGKPIVSSDIAGFRKYPHLCSIASGAKAFTAACRRALLEGTTRTAARQEEASQHSWEARLDTLIPALSRVLS